MTRNMLEDLLAPSAPRNPENADMLAFVQQMYREGDPDAPALIALAEAADLVRGTDHKVVLVGKDRDGGVRVETVVRAYRIDRSGHFH